MSSALTERISSHHASPARPSLNNIPSLSLGPGNELCQEQRHLCFSLSLSLRFTFCPNIILRALSAPVRQMIIPDFVHTEM